MMDQKLNDWIDGQEQEIINSLSELIAIKSVSTDLPKVKEGLDWILALADRLGFQAKSVLDGQIGVVEMGDGSETLGILTHVDVVSPGEPEQWDTDPFQLKLTDGKLYGRGTLDDKGMIIAALYAMKAAQMSGLPLRKKVQLIIGTQEEVKWTDIYAYVKVFPLPDYGFSPDGEYPICNIEKGSATYVLSYDFSKETDPQGLCLRDVQCGYVENLVPGKATARLSDGRTITAEGKAVHSCQPERGHNALFALYDALKPLGLAENGTYRLLREVCEHFQDVFGKSLGIYSPSEYFQGEFVHRNACSPTIFQAEDDRCTLTVNVRFAYGTDPKDLTAYLSAFAEKTGGTVVKSEILPAVFVSRDKPFLQEMAAAYEEVTGLKNEFTLAYGGSYAKAMPNIVSWGPVFPGDEDTCHEPNEYIRLDRLMSSTKIFAQTIARLAFSDKSYK